MTPCRYVTIALLLVAAVAYASDPAMDAEIDYLLESVGDSDCVFIRNGDEHEAAAAKAHLQMKRRKGRRYYDSAEEFIDRIASRSSWSGKEYRIRCGDREQTAKVWFKTRLDRCRHGGVGQCAKTYEQLLTREADTPE